MSSVFGSTAEWLRRATARSTTRERPSRRDLFTTALWLGCVGFGGGISVLSQIDGEVVKRRGWLTPREFSNTVTVSQMLPGGAAANALAYIGMRFGGWAGALAGYVGFVLPERWRWACSPGCTLRFGTVPSADRLLSGFNAAVVGIICAITLKMVRTGVNQLWQMGRRRRAAPLRAGERLAGRSGAARDLLRPRRRPRREAGAGPGAGPGRPAAARGSAQDGTLLDRRGAPILLLRPPPSIPRCWSGRWASLPRWCMPPGSTPS
jgi:chromate transporter